MAETIKFTDDELIKITKIRNDYDLFSKTIGALEIEAIGLEVKRESIKDKILNLQKEELELAESLRKKYGDGVLNPQTGIFTPNK